ncbi:SH3 domain-containing protein [Mesorhizobium sp. SP-1A]|uniref:SH3 domain-containing protein n=1 Tax=Mesorhizobium sp. SP-1A TaxID=3077840 RepID=UPI0028F727D5|nr:SH3 domain-containing protein [Mesorhizobium sp. SP-1A]
MKGFSGFGAPKQRRLSVRFGYEARPSAWQSVKTNAHLVIAAVGTAALLSVAGVALWLAMPASERQAFAEPKHQSVDEITKTAEPTAAAAAKVSPAAVTKAAAVKAGKVARQATAQGAELSALATNDPRWTGDKGQDASPSQQTEAKAADQPAKLAFVEPGTQAAVAAAAKAIVADAPEDSAAANDDAAAGDEQDATTSAISAKPDQAAAPSEEASTKGTPGHIRRPVTMRAAPKKGGSPMTTLPAKTAVQVISCTKWCQIVYKGKTGWVYKTYLDRDS